MDSDSGDPFMDELRGPDASCGGADWAPNQAWRVGSDLRAMPAEHQAAAAWLAELFEGTDSMAILRRLRDGDPLGLVAVLREGLDELAILLDEQRLLECTLAQCAFWAAHHEYDGGVPLRSWIAERLGAAVRHCCEEDVAEARAGIPLDPMDERYRGIAGASSLSLGQARRLALQFNCLAGRVRLPLYQVLAKGRAMSDVGAEFDLSVEELKGLIVRNLSGFTSGPRLVGGDFE